MSQTQTNPRLVIDTCETRRVLLGEDDPATYIYPAQLYAAHGMTTVGAFEGSDFSDIEDVSIVLVRRGEPHAVELPAMLTRGIASYIRTARWGEPETNCETFAWQVSGVSGERPRPEADFHELTGSDELAAGDLLSIGTITYPMGVKWVEAIDMVHWATYLADNIAINVTGRAGILAATPIENFGSIYPGTNTYKLTGYAD